MANARSKFGTTRIRIDMSEARAAWIGSRNELDGFLEHSTARRKRIDMELSTIP